MSAEVGRRRDPVDASARKLAKKRRRAEQASAGAEETTEASPSKKPRAQNSAPNDTNPPDNAETSPFCVQTTSFYLPLSPIAQATPLQGLCAEHLSPLILTYYSPLKGLVLSYSNARLSDQPNSDPESSIPVLAKSIAEYAVSYTWLTADFLVLKAQKGIWIEGYINVQNESHIGLVCWNLFNASIERKRLPKQWQWLGDKTRGSQGHTNSASSFQRQDEGEGHFVDDTGKEVEELLKFRIKDFENTPSIGKDKGIMSILGTLLDDAEERSLDEAALDSRRSRKTGGRGQSSAAPQRRPG